MCAWDTTEQRKLLEVYVIPLKNCAALAAVFAKEFDLNMLQYDLHSHQAHF